MTTEVFTGWMQDFEAEARRRDLDGDPEWTEGARLDPAVVRSIQRFQSGESGDGANLVAKADAAGDEVYATAVRLFVAEEQNHARLLEALLASANAATINGEWTDAVFVRLRRALGLRLELMVLLIAEVIALSYYRALRDGSSDPLTTEVADRILADEHRHVPFHCQRLRAGLATLPTTARAALTGVWHLLLAGAVVVVAWDHGTALRRLGVRRTRFAVEVFGQFRAAVARTRG